MSPQTSRRIDPEALESIQQFTSMWRLFVNERPGADTMDRGGLAVRWADNAFAFWNLLFLTEQMPERHALAASLQASRDYMRGKSRAGFTCICEEFLSISTLESLPDAVARSGLKPALTMYGMAGDFLPVASPAHSSLRFERVTDEAGLQAYADINSRAYDMPLETVRAALSGSTLWKERMHTYLAYQDATPVSAASTFANDGCLFLALVATIPSARRQGFSEATVRKALYEGSKATGLTRTVLHATEAGFPVYRRLGYHKVSTIHAYALGD